MEIRNLSGVSTDVVVAAFQKAFCDYSVGFGAPEIASMLVRRGFCPDLSFAAFDDDAIVGFVLNGRGMYDGVETCYDCGTGTVPAYRGLGIAGKLFNESLPVLRNAGVKQYVLEVLKNNAAAISVYRKCGFEVVAEYDCYVQSVRLLTMDKPLQIDAEIRESDCGSVCRMASFCDFTPSWQNSFDSIRRGARGLIMREAVHAGQSIGYCVFDPETGDVAQIAVAADFRRRGVATALLKSVVGKSSAERVKVINVEAGCVSLAGFVRGMNFADGLAQFGMRKTI